MDATAYITQHTPDLLALLKDLVSCDTTNPPGRNYDPITERLVAELAGAGLVARRIKVPTRLQRAALPESQWDYPRYNVVGKRKGGGGAKKTIHFNAHYDVVPVSGRWRHQDPFSGVAEKGWIYGRGTADMKGSIASLVLALRALNVTGQAPLMNVEVSFTADEETDSVLGADWLTTHGPIKPDYAVVLEGGEGHRVCCGHNGVTWLEVVVLGKAAHGSQPDRGVNALEKMAALLLALQPYKARLAEQAFTSPEGVVMHPTVNLGGVFEQGPGRKINTVPAEARFTIDRRVLATETTVVVERELRAELKRAAASIPGCRIQINKISENHPCFSAPVGPFCEAMARTVTKVRRKPAVFSVSHGFNDMHFFVAHKQIPTLGWGPGGVDYHAIDERARVKDLVDAAKVYAELLTTFAG
jgi:succinyl-diaminopimelate desuccinylase